MGNNQFTERPVLFSGPMILPIYDGKKTLTRRLSGLKVINENPNDWQFEWAEPRNNIWTFTQKSTLNEKSLKDRSFNQVQLKCPYGVPDDRLWVRETWANLNVDFPFVEPFYVYRADGQDHGPVTWKPSIHMPRKASRLLLELTIIGVKRLQDITPEDAIAEGIESFRPVPGDGYPETTYRNYSPDLRQGLLPNWTPDPKKSFRSLWESINGPESWEQNPWVWVIAFKRIQP